VHDRQRQSRVLSRARSGIDEQDRLAHEAWN
jgi:hypothetical protein